MWSPPPISPTISSVHPYMGEDNANRVDNGTHKPLDDSWIATAKPVGMAGAITLQTAILWWTTTSKYLHVYWWVLFKPRVQSQQLVMHGRTHHMFSDLCLTGTITLLYGLRELRCKTMSVPKVYSRCSSAWLLKRSRRLCLWLLMRHLPVQ